MDSIQELPKEVVVNSQISTAAESTIMVDPVELARHGQPENAEKFFRQLLAENPTDPVAHHNFAVFLSEQKRAAEALSHFQEALRLRPNYAEAMRNLGLLLAEKKQYANAINCLWGALTLRPGDQGILCNLCDTLVEANKREDVIPLLRHLIRLSPAEAGYQNQLGLALFDSGRLAESEVAFLESLKLHPTFVSTHNNLGMLYKAMGRVRESMSCFELALSLDPDSIKTKWNRALTFLAMGDYERGWQEYEWRWARPETPAKQFPKPKWKGEPLAGKRILLHTEQGLGDTIQFIRYASVLKAQGATVFCECQSPLGEALQNAAGVDQLIIEGQPIPPFDVHAPLLSLPWLCKTTLTTVPSTVPYLSMAPTLAETWKQRINEKVPAGTLRVGIAWQGNPHHQWDHFRSLPLRHFESLTRVPNIQLISLQRGPGIEQIESFQRITHNSLFVPTTGLQTGPEHLAESAAIIDNLDLIISVDTATAHLAGALGKRTWMALSYIADWRWMHDRIDTPWYPTMRLFRQKTLGDWDGVISQIAQCLTHEVTRTR